MHEAHEKYMWRCIQLAKSGAGNVAPNPMVGAVLVHNDRIIGEGYHKKYGEAHAEVNCINSAEPADVHLITGSTLYVSLEPCTHYGKTPPCTDLIIRNRIPEIVIGCKDVYTEVNGKGIEKLKENGVDVTLGVLENECKELNKRFFTYHALQRPYVILKWSQTADSKIANEDTNRLLISNKLTNRIVHKWRSEAAGILIGTNTAQQDNPELTNRLWNGNSPVRLVLDLNLRLPNDLKIFKNDVPTIILNLHKNDAEFSLLLEKKVFYYQLQRSKNVIQQILNACYQLKIQSILVEGGRKLLQSFIDENLWDKARIITNTKMRIGNGVNAPELTNALLRTQFSLGDDSILIYRR